MITGRAGRDSLLPSMRQVALFGIAGAGTHRTMVARATVRSAERRWPSGAAGVPDGQRSLPLFRKAVDQVMVLAAGVTHPGGIRIAEASD